MAASESFINRDNLGGLFPEDVVREIMQGAIENSSVLRVGRRLPNMTTKTQSINVLDMLPTAYWVDGDTGFKQTSAQAWVRKRLYAEELAVIIPIPEAVLDDSNYDIWGEVRPRITEAMGKRIDEAILFGINKPSTWRAGILQTATAAGAVVTEGTGASADLFQELLGVDGLIAKVEENGYYPTNILSDISMRAKLRGLVDANKQPVFMTTMQQAANYVLDRRVGQDPGTDDRGRLQGARVLHPPGRDLQDPDRGHHRGPDHQRSRVCPGPAGYGRPPRRDAPRLGDPQPRQRLPRHPADVQPVRGLRSRCRRSNRRDRQRLIDERADCSPNI